MMPAKPFFATLALLAVALLSQTVQAQTVAGTEELTGAGAPDGWTNILYINESFPFDLGGGEGVLTYTNFWAANPRGMYTPFVAEPLVASPETGDDYVVRAIGTTRTGGEAYACTGEFRYPFHDTETFAVQDGWVAGFLSADPLSEDPAAASPIPFTGLDVDGWLTGSAVAGGAAPALELNEPIVEGLDGTDVDAFGLREYQFNISAVAGDTLPPLDEGGRVGEACPPPPTPEEGKIGAPLPLADGGSVDGWSGVPVMYGHQLPAGESVEVVRYYPADAREFAIEDELYNVTPLIVSQEDGSVEDGEGIFTVWEVGPTHTASEAGEQEFAWGSSQIPDDGNLYHPAALQWQQDLDNTDGGVISFGDGGEGMHFFDVDTFDFTPEDIGDVEPEFVLSDLTIHSSAAGGRAYQLNFEMSSGGGLPGDFNGNGELDSEDIDDLTTQSAGQTNPQPYDLNEDSLVDFGDISVWIKDLFNSWVGDANLDGEFNSGDLVATLAAGTYENGSAAVWSSGDFDGDGKYDSSDLVVSLADGGYEKGPRQAVAAAVPEPSSLALVSVLAALLGSQMRRRARRHVLG